jgi:undecaprenyl diphosphate synthase
MHAFSNRLPLSQILGPAALLLLSLPGVTSAQEPGRAVDCIIEARQTVEIRSPVEALIEFTSELPEGRTEPAMTLSLALSYSGRRDIVDAMRFVAARARAGLLLPEDIEVDTFRYFFTTRSIPDVDLVIRTGGEQRLSDFLLAESAYAELHFTDVLWPDFTAEDLFEALNGFAHRERRFGRTGDQVRLARVK